MMPLPDRSQAFAEPNRTTGDVRSAWAGQDKDLAAVRSSSLVVIVSGTLMMASAMRYGPFGRVFGSMLGMTFVAAGFLYEGLSWRLDAARSWLATSCAARTRWSRD
jgi:hypothetical protein